MFSFTWAYTAADPSLKSAVPYNIALIEFPSLDHVRMVSNIVDVEPGDLKIGDWVTLVWQQAPGGRWLPRFRKHCRGRADGQ